ncbi:MAG: serine hydrolase, partial [Acidobacteriota bacterium]
MTRRILLLMALPLLGAEDYCPPPDAQGGWRRLATASSIARRAGMDLAKLDEAFAYAQGTAQHGGLLVVRHGYLLYEKYYGRGDREALPELASVGKAFTSAALG